MRLLVCLILFSGLAFSFLEIRNLKSGSMGPDFDKLSSIELDNKFVFEGLVAGDVICYRITPMKMQVLKSIRSPLAQRYVMDYSDGRLFCHRIVAIRPEGKLAVKGDANRLPDPYSVEKNEYYGKVINYATHYER